MDPLVSSRLMGWQLKGCNLKNTIAKQMCKWRFVMTDDFFFSPFLFYSVPSSALCLRPIVVLRFFIFFDISQNMIIFARFKSSSEAQLNFLRESSTLGYVRHYDLDRSCNWSLAQQLFEFKIVHFGAKTVILREVKISHMKTGRKFSVIISVFPINPNNAFERKQRALDDSLLFSSLSFSSLFFLHFISLLYSCARMCVWVVSTVSVTGISRDILILTSISILMKVSLPPEVEEILSI